MQAFVFDREKARPYNNSPKNKVTHLRKALLLFLLSILLSGSFFYPLMAYTSSISPAPPTGGLHDYEGVPYDSEMPSCYLMTDNRCNPVKGFSFSSLYPPVILQEGFEILLYLSSFLPIDKGGVFPSSIFTKEILKPPLFLS